MPTEPTRRRIIKLAVAGAVAANLQSPPAARAAEKLPDLSPGIKISLQVPTDPGAKNSNSPISSASNI